MAKKSAGLLLYRWRTEKLELLLVHPGGPFWKNKDRHAWSIPKGELAQDEAPLDTARREFEEELGVFPEGDDFIDLGEIRQKNGKRVFAWALEGNLDPSAAKSNTFSMEWPPRSGKMQDFPEVDRAEWFSPDTARQKINERQIPLIDRLVEKLRR